MSNLYKSYLFRGKDPVIDEFRTVVEDHLGRRVTKKDIKAMAIDGLGPKAVTINNWFFGKTMRPQSASIEAAARSIGYRRVFQKMK